MSSPFLLSSLLLLPAIGFAQYNTKNLAISEVETAGRSLSVDKLALFPVHAAAAFKQAHAEVANTVPLKEALAAGKLEITEKQDGAQVNELMAKNTSRDTLYLMQGEVVTGGKQDRVLAQDVLLLPGQNLDVAAFCVEQGRWEGGGENKRFGSTAGVTATKVRQAVAVSKDQRAVWENVAGYLQANKVDAQTGTFAALQGDSTFQADLQRYRAHFKDLFSGNDDVIGVVAVSGGQVIGCDLFATAALFQDAYSGLLTGYITEAISNGSEVKLTAREAQEFLERLLADEEGLDERVKGRGSLFKDKGRTLRVSYF